MRFILLLLTTLPAISQDAQLPLWPQGVPNQVSSAEQEVQEHGDILWITRVQTPDISVFLPTKQHATGQAVVICPGGGYSGLAYDWEGTDIAKWLNSKGIAGIVLKYRLPSPEYQKTPRLAPLQDAKQAMRLVRKKASQWNINPDQIGVMGFSAGGHLASTLGTHFDDPEADVDHELSEISARPDFMVLVYPVVSMADGIANVGSKRNLLGESPSQELQDNYSNELQVSEHTPPTFLVHSSDDEAVPVDNSIRFYQALLKNGISCEMHLYPHGGHGYSLALDDGHLKYWPDLLAEWLDSLE